MIREGGTIEEKSQVFNLDHINNFIGFKYLFEETVPVIAQKMAKSIAQRA
jgi:hypothetical protein